MTSNYACISFAGEHGNGREQDAVPVIGAEDVSPDQPPTQVPPAAGPERRLAQLGTPRTREQLASLPKHPGN